MSFTVKENIVRKPPQICEAVQCHRLYNIDTSKHHTNASPSTSGKQCTKHDQKVATRPGFALTGTQVWSAGGGAGGGTTACGSSGMDLKHEVAYRGVLPGQVKAEPGVHNGQVNGHVRDWMAGGAGANSPSPGAVAQPQPNNGYSSPLSSGSYGPYSPNGKIASLALALKVPEVVQENYRLL
ncbi:hypothetical protein MSG28_003325 [Choristoneura fumiferana]|uniref:Uncharacterized protein n=1 Tax=Choristoneura fumiferana TaxID=7141 RepID=A0ACC0KF28_CHOFU|nr:hypothetical protein MSG28_003325 [Choristoneura fumiferana]